jgi:hypothetical protein
MWYEKKKQTGPWVQNRKAIRSLGALGSGSGAAAGKSSCCQKANWLSPSGSVRSEAELLLMLMRSEARSVAGRGLLPPLSSLVRPSSSCRSGWTRSGEAARTAGCSVAGAELGRGSDGAVAGRWTGERERQRDGGWGEMGETKPCGPVTPSGPKRVRGTFSGWTQLSWVGNLDLSFPSGHGWGSLFVWGGDSSTKLTWPNKQQIVGWGGNIWVEPTYETHP